MANRKRKPIKKAKPKAKLKKKKESSSESIFSFFDGGRGVEMAGVVGLGTSIFLLVSLLSLQVGGSQWMGPIGRAFAAFGYSILGLGIYVAAIGAAFVCVRLLMQKDTYLKLNHALGLALGLLFVGVLLHLLAGFYRTAGYGPGGRLGEWLAETLRNLVSTPGTALVAVMMLVLAVVIATPLRMRSALLFVAQGCQRLGRSVLNGARRVGADAAAFCGEVIRAVLPERDHDEYLDELEQQEEYDDEDELEEDAASSDPPIIDRTGPVSVPTEEMDGDTEKVDDSHMKELAVEKKPAKKPRKKKKTMTGVGDAKLGAAVEATVEPAIVEPIAEPVAGPVVEEQPLIVESQYKSANAEEMEEKENEVERLDFIKLADGDYQLPSLDHLNFDDSRDASIDRSGMLELSARLVQTLENYGVKGRVAAIRPGPVVTMYEFAPAPGTRLNKIVNLSDDLAMSLEAMKVRIVAPIPGKAAVGIEVPNKTTEMVYLKEIIADPGFREKKIKLPMALGKDIEGAPVTVDLANMPHLLVAGTTGSGKSVSVNSMITSLLYNSTPDEVRMIMIDPKMLELSIYEGIPHLLLPVVTDPKKANLALRWAVDEMERRYGLLAKMGVRDIRSYNVKTEKERARWEADKLQRIADEAKRLAEDGELDEFREVTDVGQAELPFGKEPNEPGKSLPFIVVVIDEFADLMMCAPKEVETSVARIAQKARAAGIHLILATQRPSVDVITGLIKANFPSRIAFRVSSKVDSRTILDQSGAENLLGSGDMLFSDRGAAPDRLHGCFVDEDEIHKVVEFLKTQGRPVYNLDIVKPRDEDEDEDGDGGGNEPADALYDKAVQIVAESQRVSVSYIQRRLSVGYNRSAKMVERMEREGVVSAPDNKKQREVLINVAA